MALIPPDVGIRMRMQTESNLLQPVAPAHEVSSNLPEFRPGQTFSARIQETLPDNTYKALVAGKQLTLQLPEGAKAGDDLELVVVDRSAKAIIARQVDSGSLAMGEAVPYPFAKFSPAARLIGQLLPADGNRAAPAELNRGQPLLATPPQSQAATAQLASVLAKSVSQSGLFYEAHQAQWVTGQRPLEQLLQEPQGQRSLSGAFQYAAAETLSRIIDSSNRSGLSSIPIQGSEDPLESLLQNLKGQQSSPNIFLQAAAETVARMIGSSSAPVTANVILDALQQSQGEKVGAGGTASPQPMAQAASSTQSVPDDLRPLVQQQLDAAATNRMVWHGEVWPRQSIDWEIEWQGERDADGSSDEEMRWATTLSLTTPRLGRIDANLRLTAEGVRITLATPYGASAADLRDESPKLALALDAAGVPLLALQVKHEEEAEGS